MRREVSSSFALHLWESGHWRRFWADFEHSGETEEDTISQQTEIICIA